MDDRIISLAKTYCSYTDERDIPQQFRLNPLKSANRCPQCDRKGGWRSGVYFEHQKRCGKCNIIWCPDDVERMQEFIANELIGVNGDGI